MSVELTTVAGKPACEIAAADGEVFTYLWEIVRPSPGQQGWGVWLTKLDQGERTESYRVTLWPNGNHWCGCLDFKYHGYRKRGASACKHILAALELHKVLTAMGVTP